MFNHLPWYTERKNDLSSRLNAAESMRAAALLNAQTKGQLPDSRQQDDSTSFNGSGSEVGSEDFDMDVEVLEMGGDTTVQSLASESSFAPADVGSSGPSRHLPPLTDKRYTAAAAAAVVSLLPDTVPWVLRFNTTNHTCWRLCRSGSSKAEASGLTDLAALRAARARKMEVPASFSSFRMNYDQRLAQQKVNVIQMLKAAVRDGKRQLYGQSLTDMADIFSAVDTDGSGSIDVREFRDGIRRLGLGLTEPQIQEMVMAFDEDGNGEIEHKEFMALVTAPVINVSAIARQQWMAAREKAEEAEQRLKEQAYDVARQQAEAATNTVEKEAELRVLRQERARAKREKERAKLAKEEARDQRRRTMEGVARRQAHKLLREERAESRLGSRRQLKRGLKLSHQRSLEEISMGHARRRASISSKIVAEKVRHEDMIIDAQNRRAVELDRRREEREATRREFLNVQQEESQRRRELQQAAWERGTAIVISQTIRKARREAERSFIERTNQSLRRSISQTTSRPMSVA